MGSDEPKKRGSERKALGADESGGLFPDLLRRGMSLGLTGFFMTEEALRRAHVFPEKLQAQRRATYEEVSAAASTAKEN